MIQIKSNMDAVGVGEIYSEIRRRLIAALMFHGQMADYFDFLGLNGYKRMHEYQYYAESAGFRNLTKHYINHHNKLLPDIFGGEVKMIPDAWLSVDRMSVGRSTKQKAVEDAFNAYHEWEQESAAVYAHYANALRGSGHEADAIYIDRLVEDTEEELKCVSRIILDLISSGYDMVYIVESQRELHEKYKKMQKGLKLCTN